MSEPIYAPHAGGHLASGHARGPWDPGAQHGGAPAALLAREIERLEPGADMLVARVTYEFLGPVPLAEPLVAAARLLRSGRRFQVVEAELRSGDRVVMAARAVRLRRADIAVPARALARPGLPCEPPAQARPMHFPEAGGETEGFHLTGMEIRFAGGTSFAEPGPAFAWYRFARPLVAGEAPSPLQRAVAAADFGNGASSVLAWGEHLFVNTDLTVHLHALPRGEWVLLDARTVIARAGAGLAASQLFDEHGEIGLAAQTLYVEPR